MILLRSRCLIIKFSRLQKRGRLSVREPPGFVEAAVDCLCKHILIVRKCRSGKQEAQVSESLQVLLFSKIYTSRGYDITVSFNRSLSRTEHGSETEV
jgi:hypothetical protein